MNLAIALQREERLRDKKKKAITVISGIEGLEKDKTIVKEV
jgi:hypothetical protein